MLQVRTATDCTRYSQGVAEAVTSPPPPPPPSNRYQHGLITRRTRVSLRTSYDVAFYKDRSTISLAANALHALQTILQKKANILVIWSHVLENAIKNYIL